MTSDGPPAHPHDAPAGLTRRAALFGAPILAIIAYLLLPREVRDAAGAVIEPGLSDPGRATAAVALLMATWWMTEAAPLEATGLLPLVLFPVLGIAKFSDAASPYASDIIYLFLGGMLLGQGMERWGLHRRVALHAVSLVGSSPARLVGGFLLAAGFVSMWVSNTAATVMMLPIGASVAGVVIAARGPSSRGMAPAIVLAIAFGASIGGVGTLIGTPPIAQFAGFMSRTFDKPITFLSWLALGLPALLIMLPVAWLVLTRVAFRLPAGPVAGVSERIRADLASLGPVSRAERVVLITFITAAGAWIGVPILAGLDPIKATRLGAVLASMSDAVIAILAAITLFLAPAGGGRPVLTWNDAQRTPWGVLLLFGGGLSLAAAIKANGVDAYIASHAGGLAGSHLFVILLVLSFVTIFLTELASNTALVAAALPVVAEVARGLGVPPAALLATVTLAASLGFMLPAGTPPNALAFATGQVTMREMMRAGLWLDVLGAIVAPCLVYGALKLGVLPGM